MTPSQKPWYTDSYRRMLVDMHIPDGNEAFLSKYDPAQMTELYERAGLTSVMFYCQSHVGLCYWPTKSGKMHAGLKGRDIVRELLDELKKRHIAACGYYSVIYNNQAFLDHPEWRIIPAKKPEADTARYGHCCPNNPDYRSFVQTQIDELLNGYKLDGLFYDMTFWPNICLCEHCRDRFRRETGLTIPHSIDWLSPQWCAFAEARDQWINDFAEFLTRHAKSVSLDIPVYHNFASTIANWPLGLSFQSATHHDFLGADFYGDAIEQLMVSKLMLNLTPKKPMEFMTSCCVDLHDHVRLKSPQLMQMQAFAATLFSSAFLFIDAINPDGTANAATFDRVRDIYRETQPYEPHLGGEAVEDIAIYVSNESKMDFTENGQDIQSNKIKDRQCPHIHSVRGFCRILQQAHRPFGIITRKQLKELDRYKLIILPNVLRMDNDEVNALREYVRRGGKFYASGYTSLTETRGVRHSDFMLADVFGCHFENDDLKTITYIKPATPELKTCVHPQSFVSHLPTSPNSCLRLQPKTTGTIQATLTLPYASPHPGSVFDNHWASIHSSPPWEDTATPVIIENTFETGKCLYSAANIEAVESEVNDKLILHLLDSLIDTPLSYTANVHPSVWMNVNHQPENQCYLIGMLNYPSQLPVLLIPNVTFTLTPPPSKRFTRLVQLPGQTPVDFHLDANGTLHAAPFTLDKFTLLKASYE